MLALDRVAFDRDHNNPVAAGLRRRRRPATAVRLACAVAAAFLPTVAFAADVLETFGRGVQIYSCATTRASYAWRFEGPEAVLLVSGTEVGRHFAGPSWQAADGSIVVGEAVTSGGGEAGAVPWLILRAKSHEGAGVFDAVRYIVRSHTVGGLAPAGGCDKDHAGAEVRIEYSATYTFYP